MKKLLILICIMLIAVPLSAQQITNVKQKIENGRIIITYDLNGTDEYTVSIQAKNKAGQKITPAVVAGDFGNITPGKNKTIYWEPQLEGRNLEGWNITIEVKSIPKGFIFVPGGTFMMGSTSGESDENPVHSVTVSDFYIGKCEVTQKEWKDIMGNNHSYFKGDNLPVEKVSWYDAVKFCNKKSSKEGLSPCYSGSGKNITCIFSANGYRLPTEAEWEYAARGGNKSKGYTYSGSNTIGDVAWYNNNSGSKTHIVGTKQPNELGIDDMTGNVWEWCNDWYDKNYYSKSSMNNPTGPSSGASRVLRGGSWYYDDRSCCVVCRTYDDPAFRDNRAYGFRFLRAP